jgi:hypothetical protein
MRRRFDSVFTTGMWLRVEQPRRPDQPEPK